MNKIKPPIFEASKFNSEQEINNFFAEYLTDVFPKLIHVQAEWIIPNDHDYEEKLRKIDALAFYLDNKRVTRPVILEYKYKNDRDYPIEQTLNYFRVLKEGKRTSYWGLEREFNKLKSSKIKWEDKKIDDFLKNTILICVVDCYTFHKISSSELRKKAGENNVILLEVRRYKSKDDYFVLISLVSGKNRQKWQELLGMTTKSLIIQIPIKEWKEKGIGKKTLLILPKQIKQQKTSIAKIGTKQTSLEQFLAEYKTSEQLKERIRKIDQIINQTFENSIESEAKQPSKGKHRFFCYQTKGEKLLYIRYPSTGEWLVYLKENQITKDFTHKPYVLGSTPAKDFTRAINIQNEIEYNRLITILPKYLEV